jgi:ribosomal protein S18 acetylase RimI-like enzyme
MDLLVKLYDLPERTAPAAPQDFEVRRAFAAEKALVVQWIAQQFGPGWASESEAAFARSPIACFLAVAEDAIAGFACYDATARGFFGPFGVAEADRRRGFGRALLFAALSDMKAQGYGYAIIGAAASEDFYRRDLPVIEIPGSAPGFYRGMLRG